MLSEHCACTV